MDKIGHTDMFIAMLRFSIPVHPPKKNQIRRWSALHCFCPAGAKIFSYTSYATVTLSRLMPGCGGKDLQ